MVDDFVVRMPDGEVLECSAKNTLSDGNVLIFAAAVRSVQDDVTMGRISADRLSNSSGLFLVSRTAADARLRTESVGL